MNTESDTAAVLLSATGLSKSYGPIRALREVSLDIARGEVHGICGHNGAGKSTLVKILTGLVRPDDGTLVIDGEELHLRNTQQAQAAGIALVDQELSLVPVLTVEENVFLGNIGVPLFHYRRPRFRREARALLDRLGLGHVPLSARVEELPIGERQLIEIARLLGRDARLLILDEPTATLSESEIERVFHAVRQVVSQGRSVVYVSHRLGEVLSLCNRVSVFRDGQKIATHPVGQLDRRRLIELMLGEMGTEEAPAERPAVEGGIEVEIADLTVPGRVHGFSLATRGGTVVGLAGQVGSGTSEVLRALGGLIPEARGSLKVAGAPVHLGMPGRSASAGVLYVSNDRQREGLFLGQSVESNLVAARLPAVSRLGILVRRLSLRAARHLASIVGVDQRRLRLPVASFSGGNQQKVLIGRTLDRKGTRVLLLDEPTRGVDVGGRADIHDLIRHAAAGGNAVLFGSTELDELLDLADVIVTMYAGGIVSVRPRADADAANVLADMTMAHEESAA